MNYVDRAHWHARSPKNRTGLHKPTSGIAIHYSDETADANHPDCFAQVRGIQNFHMDGRGWSDIAYSWLVCRHGTTFEGRGWGIRTAAQGTTTGNDDYHAVCYLSKDAARYTDLTPAASTAIGEVVRECARRGWGDDVQPHQHFHSTSCPGPELLAWIKAKQWTGDKDMPLTDADVAKVLNSPILTVPIGFESPDHPHGTKVSLGWLAQAEANATKNLADDVVELRGKVQEILDKLNERRNG